jgi:hypothetical protein
VLLPTSRITQQQQNTMFNSNTQIVRSNANAVMFRFSGTNSNTATYCIQDVRSNTTTYCGTLNACKKAWNKHYANSRQFVTRNGVNHRYTGA